MGNDMRRMQMIIAVVVAACLALPPLHAHGGYRSRTVGPLTGYDRNGVPDWQVDPAFKDDVFTFVRIKYDSSYRWNKWATD